MQANTIHRQRALRPSVAIALTLLLTGLGQLALLEHLPLLGQRQRATAQEVPAPTPSPAVTPGESMPGESADPAAPAPAAPTSPAPTSAAPTAPLSTASDALREVTIYVPYDKLRQVFENNERGIFLPYDQFRELWQAARAAQPQATSVRPPVGALIKEIDNTAQVRRDVVHVEATLQIEVLGTLWQRVPLHLADAAITAAVLDGQPARIVYTPNEGYTLLVHREAGEPAAKTLRLEYAKSFTKQPGRNSVTFSAPRAPVTRWQVRVEEPGVKIDIAPLVAASEALPQDNATFSQLQAFVGSAPAVHIGWTPKAEGATGLEVLASVQVAQQVMIDPTVTRSSVQLDYTISRAQLAKLRLLVPADYRVVNVFDANVRRWSVAPVAADAAGAEKPAEPRAWQRIEVELFEPATQHQQLVVELEQIGAESSRREIHPPLVRAEDVGRQQGILVVRVAEGLRAEALRSSGLLQIDGSELPAALERTAWAFMYRYATASFDLAIMAEAVEPEISADVLVESVLDAQQLALDVSIIYDIQKAGVFQLALQVPENFEVQSVRGLTLKGDVAPAVIDTHRLEGNDSRELVVSLSRKAQGRLGLAVRLVRRLQEPNLLAPTGQAATLQLELPRVALRDVSQNSGSLVLYAPESLRASITAQQSLRSISLKEAYQTIASQRTAAAADSEALSAVQAYAFTEAPAQLDVAAERRKPYVSVKQLLAINIETGLVKHTARFDVDVLYSGLKSLRIDVPESLAGSLHVDTPGIRETTITPAPADLAEGYVAWQLTAPAEFLGKSSFTLSWENQPQRLDVGSEVVLNVPRLQPYGADRAWGHIVLAKSEAIDVRESESFTGLRPIDPQLDLGSKDQVANAVRAFEFHDAWTLPLIVTRYELEEIKRTSIERALVRMVITRSDEMSVQAIYRLRSARQRLAITLPAVEPPASLEFDIDPLRINGQSVVLERGLANEYFVPLVGISPEQPVLLELRYTLRNHGAQLLLPEFPEEPAVQKVYLTAYVPNEWAVRSAQGPWSEELDWRAARVQRGKYGLVPEPLQNDEQLIAWVTEGTTAQAQIESFQTDGRRYLFSTLRPRSGADGALVLKTVNRKVLGGLMFVALVGAGILLLPSSLGTRVVAAGLLLALLLLVAAFEPMLSYELFNATLFGALSVVLLMWGVWYVARTLPQQRLRRRLTTPHPLPTATSGASPPDAAQADPPHDSTEQQDPTTQRDEPESDGGRHV